MKIQEAISTSTTMVTLLIPTPASNNKMTLAWPTIMTNAAGRATGTEIGLSASYPFTGYYDGNGYTIRDLKMLDKNAVGASLFGFVNQAIISESPSRKPP